MCKYVIFFRKSCYFQLLINYFSDGATHRSEKRIITAAIDNRILRYKKISIDVITWMHLANTKWFPAQCDFFKLFP